MRSKILAVLATFLMLIMLLPVAAFAEEGKPAAITPAQNNEETAAEASTEETGGQSATLITPASDGTSETETAFDIEAFLEEHADSINTTEEETQVLGEHLEASGESGYRAVVQDDAGLFSKKESEDLLKQISELLGYGNMGIVTNDSYNGDAAQLARSKYVEIFGETNGTLFLIDMYNRRIQFFSGGSMYRTLTTAKTNEITDNIYTYATAGDYYRAASKAFDQVKITLEGGRIVAPMRYATNAAFAIGLVLIVNFIIINSQRKKSKKSNVLTNALYYNTRDRKNSVVRGVQTVMTSQRKRKHVESSGGGGGFSGGGGGGFSGGGGGGFSGGGGGHSF